MIYKYIYIYNMVEWYGGGGAGLIKVLSMRGAEKKESKRAREKKKEKKNQGERLATVRHN